MSPDAVSAALVRAGERPGATSRLLTEIDAANRFLLLRGTWVFAEQLDEERLRSSLRRLLALYPQLAGRMRGSHAIELNDAGVPFSVVRLSGSSVAQAIAEPARANRFADRRNLRAIHRGRAPLLTARLSRLDDGCVLSVCCLHACLDGNGFYSFVRNWSALDAGRPVVPPVLDPSLLPQPTERPKAELVRQADLRGWVPLSVGTLVRFVALSALRVLHQRAAPLRFSPGALGRLRDEANREAGRTDLTTNTALTAHLTRMCLRLHGHAPDTPCAEVTVVDARGRLAGVPLEFAGNAVFTVRSAGFPAGLGLGELAARIQDGLAPYVAEPSTSLAEDIVLACDLLRRRVYRMPYDVGAAHARRPTTVYVNSFARFPVYDVDFGTPDHPVRPVFVIPHDLPDPVLVWPAPPARGGVEVYLSGMQARAVRGLAPDDPWWDELQRFEPSGRATARG